MNTKYRSKEKEIMDDFDMSGELLRDTLDKLGSINKWLGGNRITINGLEELLRNQPKEKQYTIIDLGCGHGDILRLIAEFGRRKNYQFKLIGIDANRDAIEYARELSGGFPEISYISIDIFSEEFLQMKYDIALSTLFLHHFDENEIRILLKDISKTANLGIVINDLHRHWLAFILFKILGLFISNHMIVQDGLTSILRSFKRKELETFSKELNLKSQIGWKWAFRYQWLIKT